MKVAVKMKNDNRGQALVEFALVIPLLILLLMIIFEFGNLFHSYLLVTNAAREGARMGVVAGKNDPDIDEKITSLIKENCSSLDTTQLTVTVEPGDVNYRNREVPLKVNVDYNVSPITPLLSKFLPDPFLIKAQSIMRVE